MFPLRDDNPTELFPLFTLGLMAACMGIWIGVQGGGFSDGALVDSFCRYGVVPAGLTGASTGPEASPGMCGSGGGNWGGVFTSMFLHGSWLHLVGNLWFLWIFGNNVEDSMGRLRFLAFYVVTGLVAAAAHILFEPASTVPMVGASGAISGVMGAYMVLYPRARVHTLFFLFFFVRVVALPAWLLLALWLLIQVVSSGGAGAGGVAYGAHIGGFLAGVVLVKALANPKLVGAKRGGVVLSRSQIDHGGWW
ncbi:MAG: rhomboid family intramembrane serine protease [Gemmatimonadota bacterium]|nr:rhomboid family intramembrane serine protease [Gemmatimonadota bacterium]MDH5760285.1 rhomboid family intramembrane serine protease [Gemmatimonadota bacterium]